MGLHPPPQDCAQQSHREDQMPLLPHWRGSETALGGQFQLRGWPQDLLCYVKSVTLLHLPWAEGDQQHLTNAALPAGVKRKQRRESRAASRPQCQLGSAWHHVSKDTAQLGNLGLFPGTGFRERLPGEWDQVWWRGQLYIQGQPTAGHLPYRDIEFIRKVYLDSRERHRPWGYFLVHWKNWCNR